MGKLIIDGNSVYQLDDACMRQKGRIRGNQFQGQEKPKENWERRRSHLRPGNERP